VAFRVHRIAPAARIELRAAWSQLTFLLEGLLAVHGIGEKKLEMFGARFLQAITGQRGAAGDSA
jgi:hypothetical protein